MKQSAVENHADQSELQRSSICHQQSYIPTSWAMINRILDIVDEVTHGRADWVQRFFSYSFIGGIAALVNLMLYSIVYLFVPIPTSNIVHSLIAQAIAFEVSLMTNFIPNDYFTFRHLAGHSRSWGIRCLRYHITSITGLSLTVLISSTLTFGIHVPAFFSQATALILVFIYNFSFHHLFTYRRISHTAKQTPYARR
jgi:putative flippase GtrA